MGHAGDSVPGTQSARAELAPTARSTSDARHFVIDALTQWQLADLADTAALLTSEVVTNAVLHARTTLALTVTRIGPAEVSVAVHDGSPSPPRRRQHTVDATTGRGLDLLDLLAASWTVTTDGGGKTLTFTLRGDLDPWSTTQGASSAQGRYG